MSETHAEVVDTMTADQLSRIRVILNNTPVAALPNMCFPRVGNVESLIVHLDSIVTFLRGEMTDNEELRESITRTELDLKAAGRLFTRMGLRLTAEPQ